MNQVKWGVLGVSGHFIKRVWIPARDSSETEFVALASRNPARAKETAVRLGIPKSYGSYEELLADKEIEAVYIPLPNHVHLEWIKRAADAGKHVLCEKPICLDAAQTEQAIAYAAGKGVLLMEAFMYRFHPQWRRVVDLIRSNEIGAVQSVQGFFSYSNANPEDIRNRTETGGGGIYDIGCYTISSARLAMGGEPDRVVSLVQRDAGFGTDVLASAIMDFGSGRQAGFTVATQMFGDQRIDIRGTGGTITVHLPFNIYPDTPVRITVTNGVGARDIFTGPVDMYGLQFDAFSRAVRNGGTAPTPPSDALANMKVIDALFRSEKSGSWERVR